MSSDLTFFTNEPGATLLDRFKAVLGHVQFFDVLVGYFKTSGFYRLYDALESIEKIRILVGLKLDKKAFEIIDFATSQSNLDFASHSKAKKLFVEHTVAELDDSDDSYEVEAGIKKFIEFLTTDCPNKEEDIARGGNGKKLEFRVYPSEKIHAKVYISRFPEGSIDYGRVITGSSNFSESGLVAHREFNVELKNRADVEFALQQFENLWKDGVDVSYDYIDTIQKETWLNEEISPYHLYLKMLYEYFKEDINIDQEVEIVLPPGFLELAYQKQAVLSAKKILEAYNGVFLADVVGLGKTFMAALLAQQLPGRKLIICPPVLRDYWEETFLSFHVPAKVESAGKLDQILKQDPQKYDYIFIDEAHRFRNEYTGSFEKLYKICFGKKVILVTATPLNNTFQDIFSQLKLFQAPKESTIPGIPDLEKFFKRLQRPLAKLKRSDPEYIKAIQEGSKEIREKILKYVMIRRTRTEIAKYFSKDIEERGLFFPELVDPRRIIYSFDLDTDAVFNRTIALLKELKYARYMPLLYLKKKVSDFEQQSQKNLGGFMKSMLVKRLESSFFAFRKTLGRFIESYESFLSMLDNGKVFISKKVNIYDLLNEDSEEKILDLLQEGKLQTFKAEDFREDFRQDLLSDLTTLKRISKLWRTISGDPKIEQFIHELQHNKELKSKKLVIFTESKETGEYLFDNLNQIFPDQVIFFCSNGGLFKGESISRSRARDIIRENFDPNSPVKADDIRLLISTDVLSEGINLHGSNIIVNYDLPWNPTRVLQRVGRINRIGSVYPHLYIFNFFPTAQSDQQIGLEDNIKSKIQAFHDTLGEDAKYLTEEEIVESHEIFGEALYKRLTNKKTYESGDEEEKTELEYLKKIREIRDNNPELFEKIKRIPKKARSGKRTLEENDQVLTFFRKGKLKKFFISDGQSSTEVNFFDAAALFECDEGEKRIEIPSNYFEMLGKNKEMFRQITSGSASDAEPTKMTGGRSNEAYVIKRLKAKEFRHYSGFTDDDEEFVRQVLDAYSAGTIPKNTTKKIKKAIEKELNPHKILGILKRSIPESLLMPRKGSPIPALAKTEIILSAYLKASGD